MPAPKGRKRGRRKKTRTELTEAEWEIISVVWKEEPCAAGTVQEELSATRDWAYTTVKYMMDRMVGRGFLVMSKIRNLQLFRSAISEVEARHGELHKMLNRGFGGKLAPMLKFLIQHEGLSAEEAKQLRDLVDKVDKSSD